MAEAKHILSAKQYDPDQLDRIFRRTDHMARSLENRGARYKLASRHAGQIVATLFYEPSTRTRLSFESAAQRVGAGVISTENAREFSSATKGETLQDTIRTVDKYADLIVLRHHETGAAAEAAKVSRVPIINAGDGKGEHPTQALLDMRTIQTQKGRLEDLHVVIGGDLKHGRTARSLAQMLSMYPNNGITFVSTPELGMGRDIKDHLKSHGTTYDETDDLHQALKDADVVYWTRLQKERLTDPALEAGFTIGQTALRCLPEDSIIMHPLPRVGEIEHEVDADPRAVYFDQVEYGLHVRMAVTDMLL
ncbi:MAG: aspartate carbamoyltransferase [Candidatus Saccharibacteria bacterium]